MQENFELVQRGFRILLSSMSGYIGQELNKTYKNDWWNEVLATLYDQRDLPYSGTYEELVDSLDIANCIRLLDRKWNDVFRNDLPLDCRTWSNIVIAHIDKDDAMPFDKDAVITNIHNRLEDNQGLIEVEIGKSPRGYEYIYSIIKTYHSDELNVNYCVRMNIKHGGEIIEVDGSFFETRVTGQRSAMGMCLAQNAGFELDEGGVWVKGWAEDPYDPEYKKGCRMILCEKRGLDGLFPGDPLSQARELVLALTEDSYYKTEAEIDAEKEESEKKQHKGKEKAEGNKGEKVTDEATDSDKDEGKSFTRELFSDDVKRAGAFKVAIVDPAMCVKESKKEKKLFNGDKVKTPFAIPDEFRCKLNQPDPKELPGWGRRKYIGFGKGTGTMSAICMTWPVSATESLPLNNTEALIKQYHESMNKEQGLICAEGGITPRGSYYAYAIRKIIHYNEEDNPSWPIDYELNLNIFVNNVNHFINGSFQSEDRSPGSREGCMDIMTLGSSELKLEADTWVRDPYNPERKDDLLMTWIEDEKYDGLFPYHPLSELRRFVKYVLDNN